MARTGSPKPKWDWLLVDAGKDEEKTPGGIVLPDVAKGGERVVAAKVLAAGPGRPLDDGTLLRHGFEAGQRVLFLRHQGVEHEVEGRKLQFVRADQVLAVLDE